METAVEFRKCAVNCSKMAKVSKDPETKALWDGICAPNWRKRTGNRSHALERRERLQRRHVQWNAHLNAR
jgi:hypothetical protein